MSQVDLTPGLHSPTTKTYVRVYISEKVKRAVAWHYGSEGMASTAECMLFFEKILDGSLDSLIREYEARK